MVTHLHPGPALSLRAADLSWGEHIRDRQSA
jgi:hypothetical protein